MKGNFVTSKMLAPYLFSAGHWLCETFRITQFSNECFFLEEDPFLSDTRFTGLLVGLLLFYTNVKNLEKRQAELEIWDGS